MEEPFQIVLWDTIMAERAIQLSMSTAVNEPDVFLLDTCSAGDSVLEYRNAEG